MDGWLMLLLLGTHRNFGSNLMSGTVPDLTPLTALTYWCARRGPFCCACCTLRCGSRLQNAGMTSKRRIAIAIAACSS